MAEIRTCEDLLNFLASPDTEDINATLQNNIDFADCGQVTAETVLNGSTTIISNKVLDLNNYSIINLYPVLCNFLTTNTAAYNRLTIENGYIKNVLVSHGHFINTTLCSNMSYNVNNYSELFNQKKEIIQFKNVGFSVLGCSYYGSEFYKSGIMTSYSNGSTHAEYRFDNCSFYIKTRNTRPLVSSAVFANCSFNFDCEYDTLDRFVDTSDSTVFYFCTLKGKIKKSSDFARTKATGNKNVLGEIVNCYVDIETDIPALFVNVDLSKNAAFYRILEKSPLTTDLSSVVLGTDSVYNIERYSGTIDTEAGEINNVPVIGGKALTTEQMSDVEYLLDCEFLAVEENADAAV
jgi:hypothetical protein